jgi:hypothetical protein
MVMKRIPKQKLSLKTQTIGVLSTEALAQVGGGSFQPVEQGFIMKDSVIVKTSTR